MDSVVSLWDQSGVPNFRPSSRGVVDPELKSQVLLWWGVDDSIRYALGDVLSVRSYGQLEQKNAVELECKKLYDCVRKRRC